jgi:hypothetical protein
MLGGGTHGDGEEDNSASRRQGGGSGNSLITSCIYTRGSHPSTPGTPGGLLFGWDGGVPHPMPRTAASEVNIITVAEEEDWVDIEAMGVDERDDDWAGKVYELNETAAGLSGGKVRTRGWSRDGGGGGGGGGGGVSSFAMQTNAAERVPEPAVVVGEHQLLAPRPPPLTVSPRMTYERPTTTRSSMTATSYEHDLEKEYSASKPSTPGRGAPKKSGRGVGTPIRAISTRGEETTDLNSASRRLNSSSPVEQWPTSSPALTSLSPPPIFKPPPFGRPTPDNNAQ